MAEGPKTQTPARRKARKRALDVLYEADLRDLPPSAVLTTYLDRIEKPRPDHMDDGLHRRAPPKKVMR